MRSILFIAILCGYGMVLGQGSGFTFTYTGPTQIIVGPECMAPLLWGAPGTPTVHSNIPGGMIVSFGIYSISGGYHMGDLVHGGTTVTVFYLAVDNFGNNALFGFSISFIDILPPVFDPLSLPHNITVSCSNNLPPPAMVEATDNCSNIDPPLTITYAQIGNVAVCAGGTIIRRWIADDDLGNTAVFNQTITILPDNTPPVITNNLVNGTSACATEMASYTTWLQTQRTNFHATDAGCGVMTLSDNAPSPSQITSFCGIITVTFTAKDNCNNTSTVDRTFTVTNNVAPVITTPASGASGDCGQSNINQIFNNWINSHGGAVATDDCSSIFWTTSPAHPSIHDTCNAAIPVMFIAGDGCGNFDTTSASFILTDNTGPVITVQPTTSILNCNSSVLDSLLMDWLTKAGHSQAHDLCTADADLGHIFRVNGNDLTLEEVLNAWQDSLAGGCHDNVIINGVGINNVKAYLQVSFVYVDKCNNETAGTGFFGITDNGRPVFIIQPVDTSFSCSENENWQDVFTSWYNSAGGATYMDVCSAVSVHASMTADSAIAILSAALDTACAQGAHVTIQFGLQDDCGNTSLAMPSATFSLGDTTPPVIITPASDFISPCGVNGETQLHNWLDTVAGAKAIDGCGSLSWKFSWMDTSGTVFIGIPGAGPYPSVNTLNCSTGLDVVFIVSDACQNSISDTATFSSIDTIPPVIILSADTVHLQCQDTIPYHLPVVTDACTDSLQLFFQDLAGIDSCNGQPTMVIRTWTAIDGCGNSSTAQEVFLRLDTIPPTFDLPSDTVQFCSIDTLVLLNVHDNCDPSPVITWVDVISGLACHQLLTRTWTVTDGCGNSRTATQQFDLSDTSPPNITHSPGNFVYSCTGSSGNLQSSYQHWRDSVTIVDGCSASGYFIALRGSYILQDTSTWPGTPVPDSIFLMCASDISINADLVAYDACGNMTVEEISFAVIDTTGPVFTSCQAVITVLPDTSACNAKVTLDRPGTDDACFPDSIHIGLQIDGGDRIDMDSIQSLDTLLDVGIHTALWTAADCKGNQSTCLSSIEIIDENAVSLTCPPDTLLFTGENSCIASLWVHPPLTTSGKCAKGVVVLRAEIQGHASPDFIIFSSPTDSVLVDFMAGLHNVLLIARDSTGDIDTCIYVVELRDTIVPLITCQNDTLFLPPSGLENIDLATTSLVSAVSDNCSIQSIVYDPPLVNCDSSGRSILVTITAFDESGNSSSCTSSLFVTTRALSPQWQRGLCDDTLRLFANLPLGPDGNYTFNWTGPNSFSSVDENPFIPGADSTYNGTYFLTVQSGSGCVSTGSLIVNIQTLVSPVVMTFSDTVCEEAFIQLTTQNYPGNVTYQWHYIRPTGDTLLYETTDSFIYIRLHGTGIHSFYDIIVQDTCSSAPGPVLRIYAAPLPTASIKMVMMPLCRADTLFLSPEVIIDSLQYHWTGSNGYNAFGPTPPGIPASELASGDAFELTVSTLLCGTVADTLFVTIQSPPDIPVITGDSASCEGGMFLLVANSTADLFEWIDPSLNTFLTQHDSLHVASAELSYSGDWHVISFINGCPSDTSEAFHVQIDTGIQVQIIGPHHACDGDSIQLAVVPFNAGTYAWTGPDGFTSDLTSPKTIAKEGIYHVTVLTATGCESEDTLMLKVDVLPTITSLTSDADTCVNGTTSIHISAKTDPTYSGMFEYHWDGPSAFNSQDTSIEFQNVTSASNGVYTLYIVNGACTSDTASYELVLKDSPEAPMILGDQVYCYGDSIILNIISPLPGAIYTWSFADTTIVVDSPGSLIIAGATPSLTGIYKAEVVSNGCSSVQTNFAIQVKPQLAAPVIIGPGLVCEGDSLVLTSNAPGSMVQWTGPNGFASTDIRPVIFPVSSLNAGLYTVSYTLNGCESTVSNPKDITVQTSIPAPELQSDIARLCIDNPISVHVCITDHSTEGATYTWLLNGTTMIGSAGQDSCIVINGSPLQGGINAITVVASLQGCLSDTSNAVLITADEIPKQQADAGPDMQFCPDEAIVLNAMDPSPSVGVWTSSSPAVVFSDIHNPNSTVDSLHPGDYSLTWTLSFESCINYDADSVNIGVIFSPKVFPDTVDVPFGQTTEFIVTANDSISMGPYLLEIVSGTKKGNALHAGNGLFRYTPNIGFVGTDYLTYRICSTDCPEECSETVVVLNVGNEGDCFIPTLFTPNDDGVNDILVIPCLETDKYPRNKIIIFNEWGAIVYASSPYQNNWDGKLSGNPLPVATYFYIMDLGDGSDPRRSFLVLER